MKVYALWHGGGSYSVGGNDDYEVFPTIAAAKDAFESRARLGYHFRQTFQYVNKGVDFVFTPCVETSTPDEGGPTMLLYFYDPTDVGDAYPDREIVFGPREGVRVNFT